MDVRDLEAEMMADAVVINLIADKKIAADFYRALCNMDWLASKNLPEDEKIIERLRGNDRDIYSCSWRHAGGIIAEIRNMHYHKNENYMDFYCSGDEGTVTPLVRECFGRMGWEPIIQ